jgi:fibronectin type 3 domain-containing protein
MSRTALFIFPAPFRRQIVSFSVVGVFLCVVFVVGGCGSSGGNSDTTPPNAPAELRGIPLDSKVGLQWDEVEATDFKEYNVYRSTSASVDDLSDEDRVSTTPDTTFTDTGLTNQTTYYYVVTAVDNAGNESAASGSVQKTPGSLSRPSN